MISLEELHLKKMSALNKLNPLLTFQLKSISLKDAMIVQEEIMIEENHVEMMIEIVEETVT